MSASGDKRLFKTAKHRVKEAKKLLKRGRKALDEALIVEIRGAIARVDETRRHKDQKGCKASLAALETLADQHLARYRKSALREYSESIGLAVLFALMLRAFVVEAFQIPSESMVPTLLVGDHLFVNKFIYGVRIPFTRFDIIRFGEPDHGDVVVFIFPVEEVRTQDTMRTIMAHLNRAQARDPARGFPESLQALGSVDMTDAWGHPFEYERLAANRYRLVSLGPDGELDSPDDITNENTAIRPGDRPCLTPENLEEARDYIKRVIGLPGDRVRIENNTVYVNDEPIPHEAEAIETERDRFGRPVVHAIERVDGVDYEVQYYGSIPNFDEITVRDGYIFVMGDNRDNSSDSRCWGQVPVENVKGEALFIFWSGGSEEGGFLGNRWNRMLSGVH